jgi:hypothetical protein
VNETGVERFYVEAAYAAAVMQYLIENKSDNEADAEIAQILKNKPFMTGIIFDVMEAWLPTPPATASTS